MAGAGALVVPRRQPSLGREAELEFNPVGTDKQDNFQQFEIDYLQFVVLSLG